ncbi:hypothetical protein ACLB2K_035687 [Fragaria x ananassa]
MEGSGWQIANGLKVNVWKENWLHPPDVHLIQTTAQISNNDPQLKSRCCFVYDKRPISPPAVIQSSFNLALEFWSTNRKGPPSLEFEASTRKPWQPSPLDVVDVCCDASWIESGSCGIGVVIRSNSEELVDCVSNVNKCGSSAIAETNALLLGVDTTLNLGLGKVCLISNSLEVINNIKASSNYMDWRLFPIIEEIRKRSKSFGYITWEWIPRRASSNYKLVM